MVDAANMKPSFATDRHWFRSTDGTVLLAGSPLTQFTVTAAGARILDALESGGEPPTGHEALTTRLLAAGAIHPVGVAPADPNLVTVVIPTHVTTTDASDRVRRLVRALSGLTIVVVDDCSPVPVAVDGATVIRHDHNTGPGGARNTGLAIVDTPIVAFIDDDTTITTGDVTLLAGHLVGDHPAAGQVDIVAPRVRSIDGRGVVADYERFHSPLDLGAHPGVVRPGSRVSYVPSAILVCTVETVRRLGGFDESMRMGEDVDFIWRAGEHGARCRYVPAVECGHQPRATVSALATQRRRYASSSARLAGTHGDAVAPIRTHPVLVLPAVLLLLGFPLAAATTLPFTYAWFAFTLRRTKLGLRDRARVITIGAWSSARLLVTATARTWWPLFAVGSLFSPRVLFMLGVSLLVPPLVELVTKRPRFPTSHVLLHLLDDLSYGLGVWQGVLRARSGKCLMPAMVMRSRRLRSQG